MRYQKRASFVEVIGRIWMPATTAAMRYDLRDYDLENIRGESEFRGYADPYDRRAVEHWVAMNSGDFQSVTDFRFSISDSEGRDADGEWTDADNGCTFNDCMYSAEDWEAMRDGTAESYRVFVRNW